MTKKIGINLVGYHNQTLGLGSEVRRIQRCLTAAGVETSQISAPGSASAYRLFRESLREEFLFDRTLSVVAGDQLESVIEHLGHKNFNPDSHFGMWYWELEEIVPTMLSASQHVRSLVAGSQFIVTTLARDTGLPTFLMPMTKPVLEQNLLSRSELDLPPSRPIFLQTFDFLSVISRKNPLDSIRAFKLAFANNEGPLFLLKSQNGHLVPHDLIQVKREIGERTDIELRDISVPDVIQQSLIANADLVVSLHRSEGLGLHLLEARVLGVPSMITDYSGAVEAVPQESQLKVNFHYTSVQQGNGIYPADAKWAQPDVEEAAIVMRRFVYDRDFRERETQLCNDIEDVFTHDDEAGRMLDRWLLEETYSGKV